MIDFITEYQETLDLMYIRKAPCVTNTGHLVGGAA